MQGIRVALASSGQQADVEQYLEQLGGRAAVDAVVTHVDVSANKPGDELFMVALEQLGRPARAIVIGDSVYDVEAADKLGLPCLGLLTGGIEQWVLEHTGAVIVYESPAAIVSQLESVLTLLDEELAHRS
jgi:phosphoglycolate phosphatase-like HAD superfamily hydrolase